MKEARADLKKAHKKLKPMPFEDAMYAELEEHEKKVNARFEARKMLNSLKRLHLAAARATPTVGRARSSWRAIRTRIAIRKEARVWFSVLGATRGIRRQAARVSVCV